MRIFQAVEIQCRSGCVRDKLSPNFELGEEIVHAERLDKCGVTFIEPKVSPPFLKSASKSYELR